MAEPLAAFVARRRPDWDALDALLVRHRAGALHLPEIGQLDRLYRQAATDLARAQASFPGTDAERFLHQLCGRGYAAIYRPPRDRLAALRAFFGRDFPAAVRAELRFVGASAAVMVLGLVLGAAVVAVEPRGAELLVPEGVRLAVSEHRMWTDSLLSLTPASVGASAIATNNLTVTIGVFALGLTFGLGTLFVLANNGLSIGAITALCVREGMGFPLFSFIGAHGPVELSIIAIAGGAGLVLAQALIDPGELPRGQALQRRGAEAVKLVLGCAPPLVLAGVLEGFVDPGTTFPGALKIALGLALGAAFWAYLLRAGRARAETASTRPARWAITRS